MSVSKVPRRPLPPLRRREDETTTHIEGRARGPADGSGQGLPNPARLAELADRVTGKSSRGGAGGTGAGGAGAAGAGSGAGSTGGGDLGELDFPSDIVAAPVQEQTLPPDPADSPENRGVDLGGEQGDFKIWSTFKLYDDHELTRQQDVAELLQRLREAAQKDQSGVADFLRARPELKSMLAGALGTSGANGWSQPTSGAVGSVRGAGAWA